MSAPSSPSIQRAEVEDLFLFVNPKSGGNKGQDFLKVPAPFETRLEDGAVAALHIFNLLDDAHRDRGFRELKRVADGRITPVRTVVGGGDGTVMWVDMEATKHGIDTPRQCIYAIVPLGTGNDFSRVAGWGGKNPKRILEDSCAKLHAMVKLWCRAKSRPHDVWQVDVDVDESEGQILKVSKEKKEKELAGKVKSLSLPMINYFSIGQESKVGIEFDKRRTQSQTCNLMVYACQGIYTELDCHHSQHITDIVSSLHTGIDASSPVLFEYVDEDEQDDRGEVKQLLGNPECLMFLNVNSYAGGAAHFWQPDNDLAVSPAPDSQDVDVEGHPGDGRLEVVALPSIVNIALDRVMPDARRVHSGGPYYMEFFQPMEGLHKLDAYCEVDGEFYHLVNPLTVTIQFQKKLQVLQNEVKIRPFLKLSQVIIETSRSLLVKSQTLIANSVREVEDSPQYLHALAESSEAVIISQSQKLVKKTTDLLGKASSGV